MYKSDREKGTQETSKKARADHLVKCSLMPGKKRKPLTEMHVKASLLKRGKNGIKNFNDILRKCIRMPTKQEKCKRKEFNISKRNGYRHFTDDGRGTDITIDLVLVARAKMSDNKVNGPEDAVVSVMLEQLLAFPAFGDLCLSHS